jgi:hypothetical protein
MASHPEPRVGLTLSAGLPTAYVARCPGERVRKITLDVERNQEFQKIWEIYSPQGSTATTYVLGGRNTGFSERVPLKEPIDREQSLSIEVEASETITGLSLDVSEARTGSIWDGENHLTIQEFRREYLRC